VVKAAALPYGASRALAPPSRASAALTLVAMSLGFAVVQLDVTIVNVALKTALSPISLLFGC
jgi:hypothetical protein